VAFQALIDRLHANGLKTNSIKVIRALIGAAYRWASNPTHGLELPANDEAKRDRIATVEEADKLLAPLAADDALGWAVAFYAGLRKSEIEALDWPDIDFKENTVRVRKAKWSEDGRKVWLRYGRPEDGPVVPGRRGARWSSVASWERASKRWEKAKLAPIGFHEARHTYISWLVASGHDIQSVMEYAGHKSITTTRRYMKLYPGHERRSVDRLNAFLGARP
jgi:integrase